MIPKLKNRILFCIPLLVNIYLTRMIKVMLIKAIKKENQKNLLFKVGGKGGDGTPYEKILKKMMLTWKYQASMDSQTVVLYLAYNKKYIH